MACFRDAGRVTQSDHPEMAVNTWYPCVRSKSGAVNQSAMWVACNQKWVLQQELCSRSRGTLWCQNKKQDLSIVFKQQEDIVSFPVPCSHQPFQDLPSIHRAMSAGTVPWHEAGINCKSWEVVCFWEEAVCNNYLSEKELIIQFNLALAKPLARPKSKPTSRTAAVLGVFYSAYPLGPLGHTVLT